MRTYTRKKLQVQEIEDVQSLCRLCLGKTEEMASIFGANVDDIFSGLPMRIGMCLGLEVARDDALPKLICQQCNSELDKFYTFKKNCAATYRKLKAALCTVKKVDRKKADEQFDQKTITNALALDNGQKCNNNVTINLSQSLDQNEMSLELSRNKSLLGEENFKQKNLTLDENEENTIVVTELSREKGGSLMCPVSYENLPKANVKMEQGFASDSQADEVNHILDIEQAQEGEENEKSDATKTTECLPEYIVTTLIEKGILAKRGDTLEILDESVKTFNLETACGSEIILELMEEETEIPVDECNKSSPPKIFDANWKSNGSSRCCGTCGARFPSRGALVRHLRVHSGEKPFPCRTCGRRFAQREVLRRHELLHSDKLPYQCAYCPKAYTQRGALEAHARSHAPPDARPLVLHRCSRCPKVFLYPSGLSRHMSVHQGRDFPCDECPRTFNDKSSLQRHRRAHQRVRAR